MPKTTKKITPQIRMNVREIIAQSNAYIRENKQFTLCVFSVNLAFMLLLKALPDGVSSPLSIIWVAAYYIFWCGFFRYYYHLKPYFFSKEVFGSLTPSTKALVLMFLVFLGIVLLPMLPFFLGFDDIYLNFYERYVKAVEGMSATGDSLESLWDIFIGYGILALLSPPLICKPYLAWISSLRGHNASFRKAGNTTRGNYWNFVIISAMLLYPEAFSTQIDKMLGLDNWFSYTMSTIVFIYTNIIFVKIYDLFYLKH